MPYDPQTGQEYDAFGRPVVNRNRRRPQVGLPAGLGGSVGDFGFGGGDTTTTTQGGGGSNPFAMAQDALGYAGKAKDAYNLYDKAFGGSSYGPGTAAGGMLNPTEFGAFGPGPAGYTGDAFNSAWGAADAIDAAGGVAGGLGAGAGSSTLAAATSTATGPGGLLAGGGATSLAPAGAAGAAGAGLGAWLGTIAPPMAVMMAIMQLGGAFDPDTAKIGINTDVGLGPDGLGPTNWQDYSNYGQTAPDSYYGAGNQMYGALQNATAGGIDPSWFNGGVGMTYGSDTDIGLDNPLSLIQYRTGNKAPGGMGSESTPFGGWDINPTWRTASLGGMLDRLGTQRNPLLDAAPTYQNLPLDTQSLTDLGVGGYAGGIAAPGNMERISEYANLYKNMDPDAANGDLLQLAMQAWADQNRS
jgi:hypothetical protein